MTPDTHPCGMPRDNIIPFTNGRCSAPARSTAPTVAPVTHRQAGAAPPFKQWLDPADLARATRDGGMEAAISERLNGSPRVREIREPLFARIGDALNSPVGFAAYCGFYAGALFAAALAYAWAQVLS